MAGDSSLLGSLAFVWKLLIGAVSPYATSARNVFVQLWPAVLWQQFVAVGVAMLVVGAVVWLFGRRKPIPKLEINKYVYAHEPTHTPVPGKGATFTERGSMASVTGLVVRTYLTMPVFRTGNGSARWTPTANANANTNAAAAATARRSEPKALFVFLPAIRAHMNHYGIVSDTLKVLGYAIAGLDYSGHGESEGTRGLLTSYDSVVKDVIAYINSLTTGADSRIPAHTPVFIGGHGFGANIALCAAIAEPTRFAGLLLFAPDLQVDDRPFARKLVSAISSVLPKVRCLSTPIDTYSRNLSVADLISGDRLFVSRREPAHTSGELARLRAYVLSHLGALQTSFLVQHGIQDLIAHPNGTKQLIERSVAVPNNLKGWIKHPRGWHDLLHEPEAEELMQHAVEYMDERVRLRFLAATIE